MAADVGRGAPAANMRRTVDKSTLTLTEKCSYLVPFRVADISPPFGCVGRKASMFAEGALIFPFRFSVLALLVLTSPLISTISKQNRTGFCLLFYVAADFGRGAPAASMRRTVDGSTLTLTEKCLYPVPLRFADIPPYACQSATMNPNISCQARRLSFNRGNIYMKSCHIPSNT